tara:strand:+ start:88 stop:594 length:507 start_codon:yes stop_codon:yes gene_type:complete
MKPQKSPNPFEGLDAFKARSQENRQSAYENKICKKIINSLFSDEEEMLEWEARIKRSNTPLLELQPALEPFAVRSHRMNTWGMNDLLLRPNKCEVWKTFADKGGELAAAFPDHIPALLFYNASIKQDMVIHAGISTSSPVGHFRCIRMSNSGTGGIIIDTLPGFLTIL